MDAYWWITTDAVEKNSGLVAFAVSKRYEKNYGKLKHVSWKWYRKQIDRRDIGLREKMVLWCLLERYSMRSFSSHDSGGYIALMLGSHRNTINKAIQKLMDAKIIWCAIEGERVMLTKLERGKQHKHFLPVGLSVMLSEES